VTAGPKEEAHWTHLTSGHGTTSVFDGIKQTFGFGAQDDAPFTGLEGESIMMTERPTPQADAKPSYIPRKRSVSLPLGRGDVTYESLQESEDELLSSTPIPSPRAGRGSLTRLTTPQPRPRKRSMSLPLTSKEHHKYQSLPLEDSVEDLPSSPLSDEAPMPIFGRITTTMSAADTSDTSAPAPPPPAPPPPPGAGAAPPRFDSQAVMPPLDPPVAPPVLPKLRGDITARQRKHIGVGGGVLPDDKGSRLQQQRESALRDKLYELVPPNARKSVDTAAVALSVGGMDVDNLSGLSEGDLVAAGLKKGHARLVVQRLVVDDKPYADVASPAAAAPEGSVNDESAKRASTIQSCFKRYDFNESGTIDDSEELEQLCTNLCFKLKILLPPGVVEKKVAEVGDMKEKNWNLGEFTIWFDEAFDQNNLKKELKA